jgi:hypothetical protein
MLIIDRFEGDFAVVEYKEDHTFNLPRSLLPPGAKEGDVLQLTLTIDDESTASRKRRIETLMEELFE